jgi:opacity protein-like surface antigen
MKRTVSFVALALLGSLALTARADAARFYFAGDLGWTFLIGNDHFDDDLSYGGAIGVDFDGPAIEFAAKYASFDGNEVDLPLVGTAGGDLNVLSLDLSARYNFDLGAFRPYVLIGGAYHVVDFKTFDSINQAELLFKSDQNEFGLVAGGGIEIKLGDHVTVGPDVRYNLVFKDNFDSIPQIEDTDLAKYPDFLQITARVTLYF